MKVEPAQADEGGKFNPQLSFPAITDKKATGEFSEEVGVPGDLANDQDVEYTIILKI